MFGNFANFSKNTGSLNFSCLTTNILLAACYLTGSSKKKNEMVSSCTNVERFLICVKSATVLFFLDFFLFLHSYSICLVKNKVYPY
jgi:hypothetical protein